MKTCAHFIAALCLIVAAFFAAAPASAATSTLALVNANPYNGPCPVTLTFNGSISGPPGSSVTYLWARYAHSAVDSAPTTVTIPASGALTLPPQQLTVDAASAGFQSYELTITAPAGSDSDTHGKVYFTVNCGALVAVTPAPTALRPIIRIPLQASFAYFQDVTGFNPLCIPWPLPHHAIPRLDFGGAAPAGFMHYQYGGPNGDPCGVHNDQIYRVMLSGDVPPIAGHLGSVVLTATRTGTEEVSPTAACHVGPLSFVRGSFNTGDVHGPSGFSQAVGVSWYTSASNRQDAYFQMYPINGGSIVDTAVSQTLPSQFASGFHLQMTLQGPDESIARDNYKCILKYTNFALNIIAG